MEGTRLTEHLGEDGVADSGFVFYMWLTSMEYAKDGMMGTGLHFNVAKFQQDFSESTEQNADKLTKNSKSNFLVKSWWW